MMTGLLGINRFIAVGLFRLGFLNLQAAPRADFDPVSTAVILLVAAFTFGIGAPFYSAFKKVVDIIGFAAVLAGPAIKKGTLFFRLFVVHFPGPPAGSKIDLGGRDIPT